MSVSVVGKSLFLDTWLSAVRNKAQANAVAVNDLDMDTWLSAVRNKAQANAVACLMRS